MADKKRVKIYHGSGEWSALYIDGKLDEVGDHYLIDERICEMFGVEREDSDSFMRGQHQRCGVAETEAEIEQYEYDREQARRNIAVLEEEAAKLRKQFQIR